ncbi:COP9 signalosome complex subunit 8 [Actinomortierella wolfii]|nr:COP9 signalosome complex subunit 8 [Actinomortierella wolfii]
MSTNAPLTSTLRPASYLIAHNLPLARSLINRIPEDIKANAPQLQALIRTFELLWELERQNTSPKDIYALLRQSPWDATNAPLVAALQESIQEREINLLAMAYTSVPLSLAASRTSMDENATSEHLVATRGWRFDASTQLLYPKAPEPKANRTIGVQEFTQLADVVAHLEVQQEAS